MKAWKPFVALPLSVVVFYADVVLGFASVLLFGSGVAAGVAGVPLVLSALVMAAGVAAVAYAVFGLRPARGRLEERAMRIDDWGAPAPARPTAPARPPVDHLAFLLERAAAPSGPAPVRESQSAEPRPLKSYELPGWEYWRCGQTAVEGTHAWDDRGPFQLLSVHTFTCPSGHRWSNSTDGG